MSLETKIKEWFENTATKMKVLKDRHQIVVWETNTLDWPWLWIDTSWGNISFWVDDWL